MLLYGGSEVDGVHSKILLTTVLQTNPITYGTASVLKTFTNLKNNF